MATDPNDHPSHQVPEELPRPPGDLPPRESQRIRRRPPSLTRQLRQATLAKWRMSRAIRWASHPGCEQIAIHPHQSMANVHLCCTHSTSSRSSPGTIGST